MVETWFLDLDGVKSGPYQTSEIYSLVAEGEILPHHRIAQGLKDQNWITILDWRFAQAKKLPGGNEPEVKTVLDVQEPEPIKLEPKVIAPPPTVELEKPILKDVEELLFNQSKATPPPHINISPANTITASHTNNEPPPPTSAPTPYSKGKRDPAAEMFDMLQNNKAKREAKSQHTAQQQHAAAVPPEPENKSAGNGLRNTIIACVVIIIIGFAFGQLCQNNPETPSSPHTAEAKPSPSVAPDSTAPTQNETTTEVVDRSNDKMVIRSKVERRLEHAQTKGPDGKVNDKDMQDLKELKKELQELKALKDELRNNPNPSMDRANENLDAGTSGDMQSDPEVDYAPPGQNDPGYYNPVIPPSPNGGNQPLNNPNIHY